jgi:hypothetical protein
MIKLADISATDALKYLDLPPRDWIVVQEEDDSGDIIKKEELIEGNSEQIPRVKEDVIENGQARDQHTDEEIWIKEEPVGEDVRIREEEEEVAFVSEKPMLRRSSRHK